MKAAIYARYSTDLQDQTSIRGQFTNCEEFAARHGFEIVRRFSDEGITGTDDTRPDYLALIAAAKRGDFDAIIVDESSRLTRNPSELLRLLDDLKFRDQVFLDCKGFDSRRQDAPLLAGLYSGIDRMELERIRARTHRGLRERASEGFWTGGKTYGYRSVAVDPSDPESRRRLVQEPAEAQIVREIFRLYGEGVSPKRIANMLNERNVPSPGSRWKRTTRRTQGWMHSALVGSAGRASGILRNEIYIGQLVWNKRASRKLPGTSKRVFRMRPPSEWSIHEAPELRIVDQESWLRVQRRLEANREKSADRKKTGRGYHVSRYLLSGILQCGVCGANFVMADSRSYACSSRTNGGQACCSNGHRVRRDVVEPILLRGVKRDLLSDEAIAEVRRIVAEAQRGRSSQADQLRQQLGQTESAIERVTEAVAAAGISRALREKLAQLEKQRDELEAQLHLAKTAPETTALLPRIVDRWRDLVDDMENLSNRPGADPEVTKETREHLAALLGTVKLVPENGELVAEVGLQGPGSDGLHIRMVAGAGFEPATFGL